MKKAIKFIVIGFGAMMILLTLAVVLFSGNETIEDGAKKGLEENGWTVDEGDKDK